MSRSFNKKTGLDRWRRYPHRRAHRGGGNGIERLQQGAAVPSIREDLGRGQSQPRPERWGYPAGEGTPLSVLSIIFFRKLDLRIFRKEGFYLLLLEGWSLGFSVSSFPIMPAVCVPPRSYALTIYNMLEDTSMKL